MYFVIKRAIVASYGTIVRLKHLPDETVPMVTPPGPGSCNFRPKMTPMFLCLSLFGSVLFVAWTSELLYRGGGYGLQEYSDIGLHGAARQLLLAVLVIRLLRLAVHDAFLLHPVLRLLVLWVVHHRIVYPIRGLPVVRVRDLLELQHLLGETVPSMILLGLGSFNLGPND